MDSAVLAIPPSESDTSTTPDSYGEEIEAYRKGKLSGEPAFDPPKIIEKLELTVKEPWVPFHYADESIKEMSVIGILEFIPGKDRGQFMDECYRVLANDGKMTVTVPYWNCWRAYFDARFQWPPFCEQSFLCYNKAWREANVKGLELNCDFDFTYGYAWSAETQARNDESRSFWTAHYCNAVDALQLMLTKRPKDAASGNS